MVLLNDLLLAETFLSVQFCYVKISPDAKRLLSGTSGMLSILLVFVSLLQIRL